MPRDGEHKSLAHTSKTQQLTRIVVIKSGIGIQQQEAKPTTRLINTMFSRADKVHASSSASVLVRSCQLVRNNNPSIPEARLQNKDGLGRRLALDVRAVFSPALISARQTTRRQKNDDTIDMLKASMADLSLGATTTTPLKKTPVVPETKVTSSKKRSTTQSKSKKKVDEPYEPSDSEEESTNEQNDDNESLSNEEYYDAEDEDDLVCALKNSDDEYETDSDSDTDSIKHPRMEDLYSPERAKGLIEYTVPDTKSGSTQTIRRSARHSLGSPCKKRLDYGGSPRRPSSAIKKE